MKKTVLSIIGVVLVVGISALAFYFYRAKSAVPQNQAAGDVGKKAQTSLTSGVQNANPFNVNVNPYQGYKNPFK